MTDSSPPPGSSCFDVAVVGGGVVGCAIARRFTLEGASVVLLERAADILAGASKANSAILHTGFDAPPESLEVACVRNGYSEYLEIKDRLNLPVLETGAVVVAWTDEEAAKLEGILAQAKENGIGDVRLIGATELRARVPQVAPAAKGAVLVPGEHVIDPWSAPLAYLRQALDNGARVMRNAQVTAGAFDGDRWTLETTAGSVAATTVVNAAGLHGDTLDRMLLGSATFTIRPRKGQFVVFDKPAARLVSTIILPVPTERTKGIVVSPTVFGNVLVGPTAEEQEDRERASVDTSVLASLVEKADQIVPGLGAVPVVATYAGLRPATERKEYRVETHPDRNWITVGGIRSTGLTASLGIARHVYDLYSAEGRVHRRLAEPVATPMPNLAEHRTRDWQEPGYGEIVCHCELVTRREIEAALSGPLPAGDLGGLKRRTRATMGRCQGFYCLASIADMTRERLSAPIAVEGADG